MATESLDKSEAGDDEGDMEDMEQVEMLQPKLSLSIVAEETLEVRSY